MVTSGDQQGTVISSVEEVEMGNQESGELEVGIDASELMSSGVVHTLDVIHNNKKWVFQYRDLNWSEKYRCIDASQEWTDGDFSFSLAKYYLNCLEVMITDSPIKPFTATTIGNLDTSVVAQLISVVPPPSDVDTPESIKKA